MKPVMALRGWYARYERWLVPAFLLVGMVVDFVTFTTLKPETVFIALAVHASLATLAIAWIRFYDEKKRLESRAWAGYANVVARVVVQLNFGAMLSAVFIFYWFSGALVVTWPVILVVLMLMITNETLKEEYLRPGTQLVVYYLSLFGVLSVILPYMFRSVAPVYFFASGLTAAVALWLFVTVLGHHVESVAARRARVMVAALVIYVFAGMLYVTDFIPPVPLTARALEVYHEVSPQGGSYVIKDEVRPPLAGIVTPKTVHVLPGQTIYAFSSVWAPERLRTPIVHHWEYKDDGTWVDRGTFSFPITGGRQGGYRGYSLKSALPEGLWRVSIETARGQVVDRVRFRVEHVERSPDVESFLQ